mmetsp:Transcript_11456/g.11539  ORF Transcript_11456/g.11539 Transcript_11456/m.11539 type:complete len:92 (+) Transcript_11456:87-362(+)
MYILARRRLGFCLWFLRFVVDTVKDLPSDPPPKKNDLLRHNNLSKAYQSVQLDWDSSPDRTVRIAISDDDNLAIISTIVSGVCWTTSNCSG